MNNASVVATNAASAQASAITAVQCGTVACAVTGDQVTSVADVQRIVNEALGTAAHANDLNSDGVINVADIAIVINSALGRGCTL